jgi:hypothetical protein
MVMFDMSCVCDVKMTSIVDLDIGRVGVFGMSVGLSAVRLRRLNA